MAPESIRTTLDLAKMLEKIAAALRAMPEIEISGVAEHRRRATKLDNEIAKKRETRQRTVMESLSAHIERLDREGAEAELATLSIPEIRELASLFHVRIPSKVRKSEAISITLSQLVDMPADQELLRTFHERNR